jgi:hypothetical protein
MREKPVFLNSPYLTRRSDAMQLRKSVRTPGFLKEVGA